MRVMFVGSGGVGGYFGARLASTGVDVHFIARGKHLAAMLADGLAIEGGPDPIRVPSVNATSDPASVKHADLIVIAVKQWDTADALKQIAPVVSQRTTLMSLQNGILKDRWLREAFPKAHIMGGVAYVATSIERPGVIKQVGPLQRLVFGNHNGERSELAEEFLVACKKARIAAELSPNIEREIWQKFVFLVGLSGTTTTMRSTIGPIRSNPRTRAFLLDVMREVVAVGRARGIDLPPNYAEQRLALADDVASDMTSSMHHDLERGNRLEVDYLSGVVADLGMELGIPTPLNRAITAILTLHAGGKI